MDLDLDLEAELKAHRTPGAELKAHRTPGAELKAHRTPGVELDGVPDDSAYRPAIDANGGVGG